MSVRPKGFAGCVAQYRDCREEKHRRFGNFRARVCRVGLKENAPELLRDLDDLLEAINKRARAVMVQGIISVPVRRIWLRPAMAGAAGAAS